MLQIPRVSSWLLAAWLTELSSKQHYSCDMFLFSLFPWSSLRERKRWVQQVPHRNICMFSLQFCTPVHLLQLLQIKNLPVPLWHLFTARWLIFHWEQFILKLDADKVRSIDFNLFSPCLHTLSCEIAEQQPRQYRDFENIRGAHLPAEQTRTTLAPFIYAVCCCACVRAEKMCKYVPLCASLYFVQGSLLCMHTCTDISQSSLTLWKYALQIRERGFERHDISPDSVLHQTPITHGLVEAGPIILWICYGVLMLTVYPGFIIMTSVPHKGSADPARGLDGKQTKLPCRGWRQTVHHGQGQEALQFVKKHENVCPPTILSRPLSKYSFCLLARPWSPAIVEFPITSLSGGWSSFHYFAPDWSALSDDSKTISFLLITAFPPQRVWGCNGPPAAWHSTITFHCVRVLQ